MSEGPEAVSFGETMAAFLAEDGLPLHSAARFGLTAAGSESNVMAGLAMLGHVVRFHTRVGDDGLGENVVRHLRATGMQVDAVVDPDAGTGVLARDLGQRGRIEVGYARMGSAGSRLRPEEVLTLLAHRPRLLFLSGITPVLSATNRDASSQAVARARELGVTVAFDPNLRRRITSPDQARELLVPLLEQADIVLAGADELTALTGPEDAEKAARQLVDSGVASVVVKRGAAGAFVVDATARHDVPSYAGPVVDPVGAGDALAAGYLSAILREQPVDLALHEASAVAACVVGTWGDLEGLPSSRERDALLAARAAVAEGTGEG